MVSKKSIELVRELYKKDIEKFDYDFKRFDWQEYLELRPDLKKNWNGPVRARFHYYLLQRFDKFIKKNYLNKKFDPNKPTLTIYGGGMGRGLFSLLNEFLSYLYLNNKKKNPEIVFPLWVRDNCYWDSEKYHGKVNVFEYYFKLKSNKKIEDLIPVLKDKTMSLEKLKEYLNKNPSLQNLYNIKFLNHYHDSSKNNVLKHPSSDFKIEDFIEIRSFVLKKVEQFKKRRFKGKNIIGVHIRGPGHDKVIKEDLIKLGYNPKLENFDRSDRGLNTVPFKEYFNLINYFLKKKPDSKIFVASDDSRVIKKIKEKYSNKVIEFPAFRLEGGETHLFKQNNNTLKISGAKLGEEVLIETLLFANCNTLIHQKSNIANFIKNWNPNMVTINALKPKEYPKDAKNSTLKFKI